MYCVWIVTIILLVDLFNQIQTYFISKKTISAIKIEVYLGM